MMIKPDKPLQVGDWHYLPEQDKLVQFSADGKVAVTADLDNLSQKVANYFIVNAGRLITKDELLSDVWGIRDVSDGRVTRVIRVLRVALNDDTREPKYIETIPKRGYRFVAPVTEIVQAEQAEESEQEPQVAVKVSRRSYWLPAAALILLFSVGLTWWLWPKAVDEAEQAIPLLRYKPITALDGLEFYHNASEDSRYLVYSYASPDKENITVLMLEDLREHKRVQITEPTYSSFGAAFSPDGKQIVYHRAYPDGHCSIRLAQFDQTKFQILSDTELATCGNNSVSARLTWSPDATYVVYPSMSENRQMALMMKPVTGGDAEQLTKPPPSSFGDYAARFSFKGDKLAFLRGAANAAQLWLLNMESREITLLSNITGSMPGNIGWSSDDKYIIYSSTPTVLTKLDINTGLSSTIAYTNDGAQELQVLKSGAIFATIGSFAHINIKAIANNVKHQSSLNQVVFSSNRNETHAEAHPIKNDVVAVVSRRSGLPQVWLFNFDGSQQQLTFFEKNERIRSLVYSPEGSKLILQLDNQIGVLSDQGELTMLPAQNNTVTSSPSWSRSGEYVYFAESVNGRWQIARFDVVENQFDIQPFMVDTQLYMESYDGNYSFWRDAINKTFYFKRFDSEVVEQLPIALPENQLSFRFQPRADGIYFTSLIDGIYFKLQYYDFKTKEVRDIPEGTSLYHTRFSVSADEKRIFILESVRGDLDIATLQLP
ncbi:MAG: winged helix-turn-helix domain-containing protein [Gammaproteobacteria bacterium]|nr:winged helix-turn-helix domain-containing protein [Gammaproteobacteria bacterium]